MAAQGVMQLGDLRWRVDPNSVDWQFQMDTSVIDTIGGQVVQILGATLSDLVITGDFGQERPNPKNNGQGTVSWQLAAAFHQKIKSFMDRQTLPAATVQQSQSTTSRQRVLNTGILSDAGIIHDPLPLTYHDGVHDWSFKVLIKAIDDNDGSGSLNITNGKFAYQYKLTLFIVESPSELVNKVASDYFLSRLSDGLGWKQTKFNGPLSSAKAQQFITANGGTVAAYLNNVLTGSAINEINSDPQTTPITPGGTGGPEKVR